MGAAHASDVALGHEALPMSALVSDLYRRHQDRLAIVVGGGPSAPEQLEKIGGLSSPIVISANGHANKLGLVTDYVVCKDHTHTETKALMEPQLRTLNAPIASRHHWADYRLGNWPVQGNSGMMALGLAALLGCRPIIPIGFDCYQGATYFHDPEAKNVSQGLRESHWRSRYQRLSARLLGACIRPLDGFLTSVFPIFDPQEPLGRFCMPPALRVYENAITYRVKALRDFHAKYDPRVVIPKGYEFPMDSFEFAYYGTRLRCVGILDSAEGAMLSSAVQATAPRG